MFRALLGLSLSVFAFAAPALSPVAKDVPYIAREGYDPALTALDIYAPATIAAPLPVVLFVHGGGWANGDKKQAGSKADFFTGAGYLYVSVNYRLSPKVQHPAHVEDVAAAVAWTEKHIAEYKGDPTRIYLIGHSAGAHLVALVAADQRYLKAAGADPAAIRGVVPLDGAGYDIPVQYNWGGASVQKMYAQAFTADPAKQKDASPIYQIKPGEKVPPFFIVHAGNRIPSARQAKLLADALHAAGYDAQTQHAPDDNHMSINRGLGDPKAPITAWVRDFLKAHGGN